VLGRTLAMFCESKQNNNHQRGGDYHGIFIQKTKTQFDIIKNCQQLSIADSYLSNFFSLSFPNKSMEFI
jgi:hypothetical protein